MVLAAQHKAAAGPGISFSSLGGTNLSSYNGSTEGDFTVTTVSGDWLRANFYGSQPPSILDGPLNNPGAASLLITDSAGLFDFGGFDFSSNNGDTLYDIQGFRGSSMLYDLVGTLPGTFGPFHFSTLTTSGTSDPIDSLIIDLIPGRNTTSVNLDNINVATIPASGPQPVPEAGSSLVLLGMGFAGLIGLRNFHAATGVA